jgi:hypothetical protein
LLSLLRPPLLLLLLALALALAHSLPERSVPSI